MAEASLGTMIEVFVTHIDSPAKFFYVSGRELSLLDSIREEIEKEIAKAQSAPAQEVDGQLLEKRSFYYMPCIALWNDRWYRGRVVAVRADGKLDVEYIDYGNVETVSPESIRKRPLNSLINYTASLAHACRLSGDLSRMDKARFEEMCADSAHRFLMKIEDVDDVTSHFIVTLYVNDEKRHMKSVNDSIISFDATMISPFAPMPMETATTPMRHVGPMGGRMVPRGRALHDMSTETGSGERAQLKPEYPLVDLSETPPIPVVSNTPTPMIAAARTTSRFVDDLDAVLDGRAGSWDESDEEEDKNAKNKPSTKKPQQVPIRNAGVRGPVVGRLWSASTDSESVDDDGMRSLRDTCSHILSLRFGRVKAPPPGSLSAEQQVTVTRINSPTDFYAQTVQQRNGLRRLESSMAEQFNPAQLPIPQQLIGPNLCCAVYSDLSKTWRRGQVIRVEQDITVDPPYLVADVHLVDTGYDRRFPVTALKPLNEHFISYLPLVFHVKLAHTYFEEGVNWREEDTEKFRQMVENRMLIMKFMTNTLPIFDVEVVDMMHMCDICTNRVKKCTINERMIQCVQQDGGLASRL